MAENKKSFVLYVDQKEVFNELSDNDAGQLIKHIFSYVSDENPTTENPFVKLSFILIKAQLKRDLIKYEDKKIQWSEAGKASAEKKRLLKEFNGRSTNSTDVDSVATVSTVNDNVNVTVNVNDNVNGKEKKEIFNAKKYLLDLGIENQIASDWLKCRKEKSLANTKTAFEMANKEFIKCDISANECLKIAIEKGWGGFKADWIKNDKSKSIEKIIPIEELKLKHFDIPNNDLFQYDDSLIIEWCKQGKYKRL